MLRDKRGQWAIIEIVVVVAILAVLAYILVPRYIGGSNKGGNGPATPIERAKSVDCMNNLRTIRMAADMYRQTSEDRLPASLADLKSSGISGSVTRCPVSETTYSYDPATGRVWCTTPGHDRY